LALAGLLTRRPACLVLDEPTNHLDDPATAYLEEALRAFPGAVVVASHDRVFLDAVAATVLDLDAGHLGSDGEGGRLRGVSEGGYSAFLADRAAARRRWEERFEAEQDELARLRRTAATGARTVAHGRPPRDNDKFIHHAKGENVARTVRRRVRDTERRIAVLEEDAVPRPPAPLSFRGVLAPGAGAWVRVRELHVPGRLRVPRLDVLPGERVLVTGANGSGKSTLLRALAGRLEAPGTRGELRVHARAVGHLAQDTRFRNPAATPVQLYAAATRARGVEPVPLHRLGLLPPRALRKPVGELSVGQQRRLALAVLVAGAPDLVLLDEPTNHLSLALAEELEEALLRSPGTVVVASHDRWLRRRWDGPQLPL
jgi:macrolide transport system ATP-binding/permease protein